MKVLAKLRRGVVEIAACDDCRYAEPSFLQRAYLLWTFRNFRRLSVRVLNQRQRQMVERLSDTAQAAGAKRIDPALVIGRAEFSALPARKPPGPTIVPLPRRVVETQHDASGTRNASRLAKLPRVFARNAAETRASAIRRTQSHARYSLIVTLAAGSLFIITGAVAQRLWINHGKSLPRTAQTAPPPKPMVTDSAPSTLTAQSMPAAPVLVSKQGKSLALKPAVSPAAQPSVQLASLIALSDIPSAASSPEPLESAEAPPIAETRGAGRLRVSLAPVSIIYPAIPSSVISSDHKRDILVRAIVSINGTVDDVQVPGQIPRLANAIVKTVRQWRYEPYLVNGQPVEVETRMMFTVLGSDAITVRFLPAGESQALTTSSGADR